MVPLQSSDTLNVTLKVVGVVYSVVGSAGNLSTIVALGRSRQLRRNAMTTLVVFLAVADLVFCSFSLPVNTSRYFFLQWPFGRRFCRVFPFIFYGNLAISILMVLMITFNRYIIILHRKHYFLFCKRTTVAAMVVFSYLIPFILLTPTLLGVWGQFGLKKGVFSCTFLEKDGKNSQPFMFLIAVCLPVAIILMCYSRILCKVCRRNKEMERHMDDGSNTFIMRQRQRSQGEQNVTITMVIVLGAFCTCNIPVVVVALTVQDERTLPWLHSLVAMLTWTTSIINPFIYVFKNKKYRKAYYDTLFVCYRHIFSRWSSESSSAGYQFNRPANNRPAKKLASQENSTNVTTNNATVGVPFHERLLFSTRNTSYI